MMISIAFSWYSLNRNLNRLTTSMDRMSHYAREQRTALINILTEGNFIMSFLARYASAMTDRITRYEHRTFSEGCRAAYDQAIMNTYRPQRQPQVDDIGEFSRNVVIQVVRDHLDMMREQRLRGANANPN